MEGGEERAFRVTFADEGAAKLGARLTEKLKEYMGEYVDDTLVKYVIVLLGNGRSKEEVKDELDVFLGDNADAFVTWLWDHLASHLDQYLPSHETSTVEVAKVKPELAENVDKNDSNHLVSESGRAKLKHSKSRHNRDWKGLVTDDTQPPPLRSTIAENVQHEGKTHRSALRARRSVSPEPTQNRKRDRPAERPQVKREVSAPRRLLQFAVREAVATVMPTNSAEPTRKRLRSVVSTTSTGNYSSEEVHPPRRIQSVARLANPMATAIKAVAEAAEDVRKVRSGNVFDRLSRGADVQEDVDPTPTFRGPPLQDDGYDEVCEQVDDKSNRRYFHTRGYVGGYNVNTSMMDSSTVVASDSASDNEVYGDADFVDHQDMMNGTETGTSRGYEGDDSYLVQSNIARDTDELVHQTRKSGHEQPVSVPNAKHKIVNISVNVNTWKPPHFQPPVDTRKSVQETDTTRGGNANVGLMKENSSPLTVVGNGKPAGNTQKESQQNVTPSVPGSYSTGRPLEDADSRTVFVNNVHFAATKDSLSRHFNKFGEVLKVIILTDAATGHPKGSAYVEFMRKEAAENALSLDGTSFMSRIIKVVKKTSGQQEPNPTMTWPRVTRGSPFAVPRYAQAPFPRVFPGAYRARPPFKPGARSMQWKRDAQQTPTDSTVPAAPGNSANVPSASRGLTYVRAEPKSDANPGSV